MIIVLGILIVLIALVIWGALGYGIAWILDIALSSVDVNYTVFVVVALCIGLLQILVTIAVRLWAKKEMDEFDKKFDRL